MPLPGGSSEAQSWGCAVRDRVGAGGPGGGDRGTEPGLCPVDGAASGWADYSLLWPECPEAKSYGVLASFLAAQGMPSTLCFHVRLSGQPSLMGQPLLSLTRGTSAVPPVGQTEGLLLLSVCTLYVEARQSLWVHLTQGRLLGSWLPAVHSCPLPDRTTLAEGPPLPGRPRGAAAIPPSGGGSQLKSPDVGI